MRNYPLKSTRESESALLDAMAAEKQLCFASSLEQRRAIVDKFIGKKGSVRGYLAQIPEFPEEMTVRTVFKTAFSALLKVEQQMRTIEAQLASPQNEKQLEQLANKYGELQEEFTRGNGYEIPAKIERISAGLGLQSFLDEPFSQLSGGEQTKVGLGLILLREPDLLLLDEPTNHLDMGAVEWLGSFLQTYRGTVLMISHDRYFLDQVTTKIFDLEDGELTIYPMSFTPYLQEKEQRLLREFQAYEEQQKKIKKMKEAIKRLRDWANRANPPNDGLHRRARSMEKALERMDKLSRPALNSKKMKIELASSDRSGNDVIMLKGVSKAFQQQALFNKVNLLIRYQERVAIIGDNGSGKSTILKIILKEYDADSGTVQIGSQVKLGYLSQHVFANIGNETVIDLFRQAAIVTEGEARSILARFMFYGLKYSRRSLS